MTRPSELEDANTDNLTAVGAGELRYHDPVYTMTNRCRQLTHLSGTARARHTAPHSPARCSCLSRGPSHRAPSHGSPRWGVAGKDAHLSVAQNLITCRNKTYVAEGLASGYKVSYFILVTVVTKLVIPSDRGGYSIYRSTRAGFPGRRR